MRYASGFLVLSLVLLCSCGVPTIDDVDILGGGVQIGNDDGDLFVFAHFDASVASTPFSVSLGADIAKGTLEVCLYQGASQICHTIDVVGDEIIPAQPDASE